MIKKMLLFVVSLILSICLVSCDDVEELPVRKPDYPSGYDKGAPVLDYFHRIFYDYEDGILKDNIIHVGFARRIDFIPYLIDNRNEVNHVIDHIKISLQVDSFTDDPTTAIYTYEIPFEEFASDEYGISENYPELKDFKKIFDFSITELIDNGNVEVHEGLCVMITYDWYGITSFAYAIDQVNFYGKTIDGKFILDSVCETIHLPNSII